MRVRSRACPEGPAGGYVKELPRSLAPGPVESGAPRGKAIPLSAERVGLQTSIAVEAYENLRYAQALLGLTTNDLAAVIERASELIVREAEKKKFCATSRPRGGRHGSSLDPRHIPAAVKRAVWVRDGGQCERWDQEAVEMGFPPPRLSVWEAEHFEEVRSR